MPLLAVLKRLTLAGAAAALTAACTPLSLFATLSPKDPSSLAARDQAYGAGPRQRLDVYAPPGAKGQAPVAVFFYGGSWDSGRRQDYGWVGRAMASRGFVTIVADYRIYPEVRYPVFLTDGAQAVKWAQDHAREYGGDPDRIVLAGHSAGAYNAVMLGLDGRYLRAAGVDPRKIKAVAGVAGPYDFLPFDDPIAKRIFGKTDDPPATQPMAYVTKDSPAAFLATGDADTLVYPRNTTALAKKLREAGVPVEERHYPGVGHVRILLALSRPLRSEAPVLEEMTEFLRKHAE
ncbi:MAG: alpha/beta hydrolase [Alphaproteobacteria bacterium]|nr:alpha/beta hydrolase [Alphaproteobacteria bacterium]MBU1516807.1 alpha/beta hydrolase [Alphaproteobacteria bacterium]MBU2092501.1 alpha/beta hydrolase [Alphaproteobacteria bacterium]MBU2152368.1 alpha/beta hydrolase [Alphaproteobacteria bacterium]MBU2305579.1 alpha/beta hydrolase [Alphaproteobacteria bacterium]